MPKRQQPDVPGTWHHVMNRGARRADIFLSDHHREIFLQRMATACLRHQLVVHAFVLMGNHYHILLESRAGRLSQGMHLLDGAYARCLNMHHNWDGPIFKGRYRNVVIRTDEQLIATAVYIHENPVRAGLVASSEAYVWSSAAAYLRDTAVPAWLSRDFVLGLAGGRENFSTLHTVSPVYNVEDPNACNGLADFKLGHAEYAKPVAHHTPCEVLAAIDAILARTPVFLSRTVNHRIRVFSLYAHTALSHAEIGVCVQRSTSSVGRLLRAGKQDVLLLAAVAGRLGNM